MMTYVWAILIYWLVYFVASYAVVEVMQDWLYDEVLAKGWQLAAGTLALAALSAWLRPSFDTMFTSDIAWTVLQAIAWFLVFMLFQFHPKHAVGLGPLVMVLASGLATLGVDSLTKPSRTLAPVQARPSNEPIRKSLSAPPPPPAPAPEK
jgi:hypothetical protein